MIKYGWVYFLTSVRILEPGKFPAFFNYLVTDTTTFYEDLCSSLDTFSVHKPQNVIFWADILLFPMNVQSLLSIIYRRRAFIQCVFTRWYNVTLCLHLFREKSCAFCSLLLCPGPFVCTMSVAVWVSGLSQIVATDCRHGRRCKNAKITRLL